ncbi:MAG: hypothetical protein L6E13_03660 [Firmicutes bacterium]|nr:hypothetical protein [Bacillota bacterium]
MIPSAMRRLVAVGGLFALANGLSGLFTGVYLFRLRPGLETPATYALWQFLALLAAAPALGWLIKTRGAVLTYQIGTGLHAGFYLALLLLRERAALHLEALGAWMGLALGAWAMASHVLVYDVIPEEKRELYFNQSGLVTSLATLVTPLLAGWMLSALPGLTGYRVIFVLSFVLFAASAALSLGLTPSRPPAPFRLGAVLPGRDPDWRRLLLAHSVLGLRDGITSFAINLLVYLTTGGEARVGQFTFLTGALGLASYWVASRLMHPGNREKSFRLGAVGMAAATGVLAFGVSWPVLLAYGVLQAVVNPVWLTSFSTASFSIIRRAMGSEDLRVEMIAAREIPLNLGRVVALLGFLALVRGAGEGQVLFLRWLLPFLGLPFPLAWLLMRSGGGQVWPLGLGALVRLRGPRR